MIEPALLPDRLEIIRHMAEVRSDMRERVHGWQYESRAVDFGPYPDEEVARLSAAAKLIFDHRVRGNWVGYRWARER
jgi:hypothetical protein